MLMVTMENLRVVKMVAKKLRALRQGVKGL
jgi:hypothetical protein